MSTRLIINGAAGRMGRRLMALAADMSDFAIVGALDWPGHPAQGRPYREIEPTLDLSLPLSADFDAPADVMIDFSTPEATVARAAQAAERGIALVIGTTGLSLEQESKIREASRKVPLIHASNYSLGVNLMLKIAARMAQVLKDDFNIEITEAHHNRKVDAPSGTALSLAQSICEATGRDYPNCLVHGREGRPGARTPREIGMHSLRMGSVVGDHTVFFASDFERLELTHRAQTRDVFAAGALRAGLWLAGKQPGAYSMQDMLEI